MQYKDSGVPKFEQQFIVTKEKPKRRSERSFFSRGESLIPTN